MKWPAKYVIASITDSTTRLLRRFAWLPVYIDGFNVWLTWYDVLQVYRVAKQKTIIDGQTVEMEVGAWIDLAERLR